MVGVSDIIRESLKRNVRSSAWGFLTFTPLQKIILIDMRSKV